MANPAKLFGAETVDDVMRFSAWFGILFSCVPLFGGTEQASAQTVDKHGAWEKRCEMPPGASTQQCFLIQNVVASDRPNLALIVIALTTADRQARLLRVIAPLGVLLSSGLGLSVGGQDVGSASYVRCLPNGCIAEAQISDSLLVKLESSQSATLKVFQTPEEGISVELPLNGFKEAFQALP
jgi:invasion protein IalB